MDTIKKLFNEGAPSYDANRKKLIPCFDKFYSTALAIINKESQASIKVLDLGAGTGLMSYYVLKMFPNANMTLIDLSQGMLEIAKERLLSLSSNFEILEANYVNYQFTQKFDVVISALSIHHLDNEEKQVLFTNIYSCLKPGGQFINADQVLGSTTSIEAIYRDQWLKEVTSSGISQEELAKALERMKEDKMSKLDDQLKWLREIGFEEVNCWFKDYSFVVFSGRKNQV